MFTGVRLGVDLGGVEGGVLLLLAKDDDLADSTIVLIVLEGGLAELVAIAVALLCTR